jgi:hypothetical protein
VPLSEHEQRVLEQIEASLVADDPKFANIYRRDLGAHYRRQLLRLLPLIVVAAALVGAGFYFGYIALVAAGCGVAAGTLLAVVPIWLRIIGRSMPRPFRRGPRPVDAAGRPRRPRRRRRMPVRDALVERWEHRRDSQQGLW